MKNALNRKKKTILGSLLIFISDVEVNQEVPNKKKQFESTKCKDISNFLFCARTIAEEKEEEIAQNIDVNLIIF